MQEVIDKHYTRLADNYDEFLFYSPDFVRSLTSMMIEKLELHEDDTLVDLGCGTGIYSLDILKQVPLKNRILGVDPYEQMLSQIPPDAPITRLAEDALTFAEREGKYQKILIKETIHHIDDRQRLLSNLHARLADEGILLLVHVPPAVKYPLFPAALARCLTWHANPDELVLHLEAAGFQVERDALQFSHAIPKDHYVKMVQHCYMSVLTSFTPDELQAGIAEMKEIHADQDVLEFVDHFDFITARKV